MNLAVKEKNTSDPIRKKTAVSILIVVLLPTLFAIVLLIAFKAIWAIPFLLLLLVIAAGIVKKVRPDFFAALKSNKNKEISIGLPSGSEFKPSPSRRSYLVLVSISQGLGQQITVNSSPFVIGRAPESDFRIADNYVSNRHLIIEFETDDNKCYATDVSSNGTYLNSVRMQNNVRRPLYQGDTLQIAGLLYKVEYVHF